MDGAWRSAYFSCVKRKPIMSDAALDSRMTCVVCDNAFTPAELDRIESHGDALAQGQATLTGAGWAAGGGERVRITRTAWMARTAETEWLYERLQSLMRTVNERVYQFDLRGFSEEFQYTVYHGAEGSHYDWHIDLGARKMQRKLSLSLQLTDPGGYEGCDLQFRAGHEIETAPRQRGAAIVFPSFVLHRVTPIASGTRKSLVVWAAGPKFR
jgi:PKHD-type hydroxylase